MINEWLVDNDLNLTISVRGTFHLPTDSIQGGMTYTAELTCRSNPEKTTLAYLVDKNDILSFSDKGFELIQPSSGEYVERAIINLFNSLMGLSLVRIPTKCLEKPCFDATALGSIKVPCFNADDLSSVCNSTKLTFLQRANSVWSS